jgi:hypothetical protein
MDVRDGVGATDRQQHDAGFVFGMDGDAHRHGGERTRAGRMFRGEHALPSWK